MNSTFRPGPDDHGDARNTWESRNKAPANTAVAVAPPESETTRIIVKINNLEAWNRLNVNTGSVIPSSHDEWIVTAQIRKAQLDSLREKPFVISLEHDQLVGPAARSQNISVERKK